MRNGLLDLSHFGSHNVRRRVYSHAIALVG